MFFLARKSQNLVSDDQNPAKALLSAKNENATSFLYIHFSLVEGPTCSEKHPQDPPPASEQLLPTELKGGLAAALSSKSPSKLLDRLLGFPSQGPFRGIRLFGSSKSIQSLQIFGLH